MRSKLDCLFDGGSGESPRLDILMTEMSITSVTWASCDSELINPILSACSETENSELSLALNLEF